jgi:hypothetical protein
MPNMAAVGFRIAAAAATATETDDPLATRLGLNVSII